MDKKILQQTEDKSCYLYLATQTKTAFLLFLNAISDLHDEECWASEFPISQEMLSEKEFLVQSAKNLKELLSQTDRNTFREEVKKHKQTILRWASDIQTMLSKIDHFSEDLYVMQAAQTTSFDEEALQTLTTKTLRRAMEEYDEDVWVFSRLLASFPVHMAKEKLFAYVKKSLLTMEEQLSLPCAKHMQTVFKTRLGILPLDFSPIDKSLKDLFLTSINAEKWLDGFQNHDETSLQKEQEQLKTLCHELAVHLDHLSLLFEAHQMLEIVLFFGNTWDVFFNDDEDVLKDVCEGMLEALEKNTFVYFQEQIDSVLLDTTDSLLDEAMLYWKNAFPSKKNKTAKSVNPITESKKQLQLEELRNLAHMLHEMFYADFEKFTALPYYPWELSNPPATSFELNAIQEEFIQEFKQFLQTIAPNAQRTAKRYLMGMLHCAFDVKELEMYINESLLGLSQKDKQLVYARLCRMAINNQDNQTDFDYSFDDDE